MAIDLDVHGNTKPLEAAVQAAVNRIRRQPIKITIDDKGATQPLGNMKRGADEFTKSMEAANARILAFGASMAIINGVGNAFKGMVKNLVEVEKALADINVVMGLSTQNLDKFSDGLFKVAKETGAAFRVAADAATEYARQGLGVEESLKRTRDALVLTRLTGMDSAEAVKSLTAAMNTYGNQIKDTTQLVSKFAAVDVKFAVSAEDFADAISRTGQSAKSAGVSIDELVGIVTSAQQQTARGGAVIGNALKTIFTKTGRTDTLNQLENLGIAVRDLEGNTLGAKRILSDLANTFDKLSEAQKAQITQTMGGLFHINILKAVLSDAAKQNGIMAEATRISAGATDEAIQKNEELRKTMSAVATETGLAIKQVSAQIGEIALAPGMEKILNTVKSLAEGLSNVLGDGETTGSSFATGFLKGIGNVITGPGLVVLAGVFFKLFGQALKFTKESLTSLVGVTTEKQKQKAIQTSLVALFGQNAALNKEMLRTDIGRTEKEKIILGLLKAQVVEANALNKLTAGMAGTLYRKGYGANLTPVGKKASGHIPNFANPERAQAAQGGYAAGSIRTMNMPGEGPVIYNSAETVKNFAGFKQPAIMPPQSSKAGKNYQQAFGDIHGFDPYAAGGYIPNYAARGGKGASKGAGARPRIDLSNPAIMQEIDEKTKYLNAGSNKYIGLSASLGPDSPKQTFYVAGGSGTDSGIYNQKGKSFYKNAAMQRAQPRKIDVEFKSLDEKDERRGFQRYDDEINEELQKKSKAIVNGMLKTFKQPPMLDGNVKKDLPKSKMATVAGHIFEAVTKSVLRSVGAEAAIPDKENELIDLLPNKELYKLFDVDKGKGSSGAEAKINTNLKNVMGFARKIYSSDPTTKTPLNLTSLPKKGKAYGHIPNFAAMTISRLGGLGKSKFGLAAVINSNPYFAQLLKRYGHWSRFPPQDKAKLNKFLLKQGFTNRALQGYGLASIHSKSIGEGIANIAAAGGYIPNFADPLSDAIGREKAAGVPVSQIRVGSHGALMNKSNPLGLGVTNTHDEPNGLRDVFGANGFVPNYAEGFTRGDVNISGRNFSAQDKLVEKLNRRLKAYIEKFKAGEINQKQLNDGIARLSRRTKDQTAITERVTLEAKKSIKIRERYNAAMTRASTAFQGSAVGKFSAGMGKMFSGSAGMAMMMGAPMAAGFLQQGGMGAQGGNQAMYAAGGALTGAASGAMMASMIAPMFGPAAPLVIGVGGLIGAVQGLTSANEENTKALKEKEKAELAAQKQSAATAFSGVIQGEELAQTLSSANISPKSLSVFGLSSKDTVSQALKKSGDRFEMPEFLKKTTNLLLAGSWGGYVDEAGIERQKKSLKSLREDPSLLSKPEEQLTSDQKKDANLRNLRISYRYQKESKDFYGLPQMADAPDANVLIQKEKNIQQQQVAARNELVDFFMKNEKRESFDYNFGEKGTAYLNKTQYANLLKGKEVDVGGKIGKQTLSEEAIRGELVNQGNKIEAEYNNNKTEQVRGIILQLNLQKAQIQAQQASADKQFEIKSQYIQQSNMLKMQEKLMGGFISDKQKAENKYTSALNKAANAYAEGAETARLNLKTGIMTDIMQNPALEQALKQALFTDKPSEDVTKEDLTNKLAGMDDKELIDTLRNLKVAEDDINEIIQNRSLLYDNQITALERQQSLSLSQAANEKQINLVLAERKKILDDMVDRMEDFASRSQFLSEKGGLERRISAAQREGTGYISADRQLQIQRSEMEKYTIPELRRQGRVQKESILKGVGVGFSDEEQKQIMAMRGKNLDIAEVVKAQRGREFNEGGGQDQIDYLTNKINNAALMPGSISGIELAEANAELNKLKTLDKERVELSDDLTEKIEDANTALKRANVLNNKNVEAVKEEQRARERMRQRMTGPGAFGNGIRDAQGEMLESVKTFDYQLGDIVTTNFRDGIAEAMKVGLSGAEDLDEALMQVASNFLQAIQNAFLQNAANAIVSAIPMPGGKYRGGAIRNYSRGGGVPAMVSNGEYVMGRDAVAKYGGAFMHGMNAGGSIPGFSNGGKLADKLVNVRREKVHVPGGARAGSALAAGFGGGRGYASGRAYQSRAMSGFFYSQSGNVGLSEDTSAMQGILAEEERKRREAEAKKAKKKAFWKQLLGTALSAGISYGVGFGAEKGLLGKGAQQNALRPHADFVGPMMPRYFGGPIQKYASGGHIAGKSGIDQIPAMLSEGEYVIRASSARQIGRPMLDRINAGKFNDGGAVSEIVGSSETGSTGGNTNNINISINMERGSSNQKQQKENESSGQNPADRSNDEQSNAQLAERIKQQVVAVIVEEQRPGGLLSD